MTPANYVIQILKQEKVPGLGVEHIHAFSIGTDMTTEPILVVSELPDYSQDSGNDEPVGYRKMVQLQFYYSKDYSGDMDGLEALVRRVLYKHRIYQNSNAGHVMTPDTENIINTLKFIYYKEEF